MSCIFRVCIFRSLFCDAARNILSRAHHYLVMTNNAKMSNHYPVCFSIHHRFQYDKRSWIKRQFLSNIFLHDKILLCFSFVCLFCMFSFIFLLCYFIMSFYYVLTALLYKTYVVQSFYFIKCRNIQNQTFSSIHALNHLHIRCRQSKIG